MSMTEERLAEIERRLGRLENYDLRRMVADLAGALGALVARLHELDANQSLAGVFAVAAIHGVKYTGPNWKEPLAQADAAITPRVREIAAEVEAQKWDLRQMVARLVREIDSAIYGAPSSEPTDDAAGCGNEGDIYNWGYSDCAYSLAERLRVALTPAVRAVAEAAGKEEGNADHD